MPFKSKNLMAKPCLVKPILITLAIFLIIGGIYTFFGNKDKEVKSAIKKTETNSTGLDANKEIENVGDVEEVIAKWVEANPQAVLASVANMQKKMVEEQMKAAQKNISSKKDELFNDKNSPQYTPSDYDVTIVEFFDYSCGYCKKAQNTVEKLLEEDKKVRVIYKEFPILGNSSEEMSIVALAVNILDSKSYKKFHDALMKSNERGKLAALKVAKSIGLNDKKLEEIIKKDQSKIAKIIEENRSLGASIGVSGTPGFIIGEELIPGALDISALKEKISEIRK